MNQPDWIDFDKDKMNGKEYFEEMEREFPELVEELNWWEDDNIHLKNEYEKHYLEFFKNQNKSE